MSAIIFTIDDEVGDTVYHQKDGFHTWLRGEIKGTPYGSPLIAKLLHRYEMKGDFFLSVLEAERFGESNYQNHCQELKQLGHHVHLHTHPKYIDVNRPFMHQYHLSEQIDILRQGKEDLERWTGCDIYLHRAGSYSVNDDSYVAMQKVGLKADSSYLNFPQCQIWNGVNNSPFHLSGIQIFPITTFPFYRRKFGFTWPCKKASKLDINMHSVDLLKKAITNLYNKVDYIMLFLHSFSLLCFDSDCKVTAPNEKLIRQFEELLMWIKTTFNPSLPHSQTLSHWINSSDHLK